MAKSKENAKGNRSAGTRGIRAAAGGGSGARGARTSGRAGAGKAGARKPGKAAVGESGVMPEVGAARVEATPALGTRPTATRRPAGKAAAQLPGEKAVRKTDQTFPVEPERAAPGDDEAMPAPAVDRRRQIVGTDDPRGKRGR